MQGIPRANSGVFESITDVDKSSDNSIDDSLSEPEPKKRKTDEDNVEEDEDDDEDDEEEVDEDEDMTEPKKKEYTEPTDEELLEYFIFHPDDEKHLNRDDIIEKKLPVLRAYLRELEESDGFDIETIPNFGLPCGGLVNVAPNYAAHFVEEESYYNYLADWAIDEYNTKNGTNYEEVQYVKTNLTISNYVTYYLTFTAMDAESDKIDARKTFQSVVAVNKIDHDEDPIVDFCRLKSN